MNIILKSNTLSRSELEAGLSLSRAFFPEAQVEFEEEDNHQSTVSTNLSRENDAVNDELGILHIDIHYPDAPWRIEGYFNCKTGSNFTEVSITLNEEQIKFLLSHPYVGKEGKRKALIKEGAYRSFFSENRAHSPLGNPNGNSPQQNSPSLKRGRIPFRRQGGISARGVRNP